MFFFWSGIREDVNPNQNLTNLISIGWYDEMQFVFFGHTGVKIWFLICNRCGHQPNLQGTNISPHNGILKMIFLFPRWDMLIPWRVFWTGTSVFKCGCIYGSLLTLQEMRKYFPVTFSTTFADSEKEILFVPGKPETSMCKWFFQLDDSKSLHGTWLFKQTSIPNCLFGVQV